MINKNQFLKAMVDNDGRLNEMELGERLGFTEDETQRIISQLLDEHKLVFTSNKACNYKPLKQKKR